MKFAIAITILQLAAGACAGPLRGSDASVNVARFGQRDVDTTAPVLSARKKGKAAGAVAGAAAGTAAVAATGAVTKGTSTLVLKESGGVAGNECLTFRNNGQSTNTGGQGGGMGVNEFRTETDLEFPNR